MADSASSLADSERQLKGWDPTLGATVLKPELDPKLSFGDPKS